MEYAEIFHFEISSPCPECLCGNDLRVLRGKVSVAMPFDAQSVFANLAEKEKVKGHHSPEGRAIRTLSRALHGWSTGNLSSGDVVILCDQAIEDWLKARLTYSAWSERTLAVLIGEAAEKGMITRSEAACLQKTHDLRLHATDQSSITAHEVEGALESCIHVVDKRW